jgi:hypothetical protein
VTGGRREVHPAGAQKSLPANTRFSDAANRRAAGFARPVSSMTIDNRERVKRQPKIHKK